MKKINPDLKRQLRKIDYFYRGRCDLNALAEQCIEFNQAVVGGFRAATKLFAEIFRCSEKKLYRDRGDLNTPTKQFSDLPSLDLCIATWA